MSLVRVLEERFGSVNLDIITAKICCSCALLRPVLTFTGISTPDTSTPGKYRQQLFYGIPFQYIWFCHQMTISFRTPLNKGLS